MLLITPTVCFNCVFSVGLSSKTVHQSPAQMFKVVGKQVLINCNHSNSDFYMIQWYKQSTRRNEMTLIGFARYDSQAVEGPFQALYNVSGDGRSASSLHFLAHGSAIYFSAASEAPCCITRAVCNKNPHHTHLL